MKDNTSANGAPSRADDEPSGAAFHLDERAEARCSRVLARLRLRAEPAGARAELWLDGFDRRLEEAGIELAAEVSAEGAPVRVRLARPGARPAELELPRLPEFAWDFPPPHAQALAETLEARALQPLGVHEVTRARSAVLDDQEKTVGWIEHEAHRVRRASEGSPWRAAERRLVVRGVRGYDAERTRLERALGRAAGRRARRTEPFDPRPLLAPRRSARGRWPALGRDVRAFAALARIGRAQLAIFEKNLAGMRVGHDAEHLHDARVALRRLRSLLGQLEGVYRRAERERMVEELRWLAGRLGPLRDVDTLLFRMRLVEPDLAEELRPATERVERERAALLEVLRTDVASERWAAARALLKARLAVRAVREHGGRRADKPFLRVLAPRLAKRLEQVTVKAQELGSDGDPAALHRLRIACKKLRYLLECCRGLVPKPVLARTTADLKGLQSVLGRVQDAEVHGELVERFAHEELTDAGPRTWLALGRLKERVMADGRAARAGFAELAVAFTAPDSRANHAALLGRLTPRARRRRSVSVPARVR